MFQLITLVQVKGPGKPELGRLAIRESFARPGVRVEVVRLPGGDAEFVAARDMLLELREDNLRLVEDLRAAKQLADDAKDNATSALIDEWTDQAEKRVWFLFEAARP